MTITHVSDTAKWVAVYRAIKTERPDAIFRDPFARRLAGEHGERIVQTMKRGQHAAWAMIVRTAVMDEMILAEIANNRVDCVINLAAGLDTRPFRLARALCARGGAAGPGARGGGRTPHLSHPRECRGARYRPAWAAGVSVVAY